MTLLIREYFQKQTLSKEYITLLMSKAVAINTHPICHIGIPFTQTGIYLLDLGESSVTATMVALHSIHMPCTHPYG
jgi:hypothetical protein